MLKKKILDGIRKLVSGNGPAKRDAPDQRIQKIHLLLDHAEKNIGKAGGTALPRHNNEKKPVFVRKEYSENLAGIEKDIERLNAHKSLNPGQNRYAKSSADMASLAREIDAVKRMLLEYSETTKIIMSSIAAEKMQELEKVSMHDRDINIIKSELLKAVRVADSVSAEKKRLENRIKKIEASQSIKTESDARMRKEIEAAVGSMPAQRDYASVKNSIIELKKSIMELRAEMDTEIEGYPETMMQLKKEISKIKHIQASRLSPSPERERISSEMNSMAKELAAIKKTVLEHGKKMESLDRCETGKEMKELEKIRVHDKDIRSIKSQISASAGIKDSISSNMKELDKRIKKIEDLQNIRQDSDALIRKMVGDAIRNLPAQKDHTSIKNSVSEIKKGLLELKDITESRLEESTVNLMNLEHELSKIKDAQKIRDIKALKTDKVPNEVLVLAKEIAAVKKTLLEHGETMGSALAEISAANKSIAQNRATIESISGEVDREKGDALAREDNAELIEEELSGIEGEIGGIKGALRSIRNTGRAKKKNTIIKARRKRAMPMNKKDVRQKRRLRRGLLQKIRDYTNEERLRATGRKPRGLRGSGKPAIPAGIKTIASNSGNPEYVELKLAIENRNRKTRARKRKINKRK